MLRLLFPYLLKFFLSILTFYLSLISFIFLLLLKINYKNLKGLLKTIKEEKLPNEDTYLASKKIINIEDLFNKYSIPKNLYNNNQNNFNQSNKILEFKRK